MRMRLFSKSLWMWPAMAHLALVSSLSAQPKGRDAGRIYADLCAGCHGQSLEGGKAGGLLDREWKYGSDEASIARSIREGMPQTGMPGFGESISPAETTALVAFILEMGTRKIE